MKRREETRRGICSAGRDDTVVDAVIADAMLIVFTPIGVSPIADADADTVEDVARQLRVGSVDSRFVEEEAMLEKSEKGRGTRTWR